MNLYCVSWDNGHASGIFPQVFSAKREAEQFARDWKREMVAVETEPDQIRDAKESYQWEIVQCPLYVERNYEWPGHSWSVYAEPKAPRATLFTECPFKHVLTSAINWLKAELAKPDSDYFRQHSITL